MNNYIRKISWLIFRCNQIIFEIRIQNLDKGLRKMRDLIDEMNQLITEITTHQDMEVMDINQLLNTLGLIMDVQQKQDYTLLGDYIEIELLSFLKQTQEKLISDVEAELSDEIWKVNRDALIQQNPELVELLDHVNLSSAVGIYDIQLTSCGEYTACYQTEDMEEGHYLHSNVSPYYESYLRTMKWCDDASNSYVIYGIGLGYDAKMLKEQNPMSKITIHETSLEIIRLALMVTDLSTMLTNETCNILYDPDLNILAKRIREFDIHFVVHYPSIRTIRQEKLRMVIENFFLNFSSMKNQSSLMNSNFEANIQRQDPSVDELKNKFQGKNLYIIAAGPSLDKNFDQISEIRKKDKNSIILATGTVFRKFIRANIQPDYVIVTDANERVYSQIQGYEQEVVPMLYLSTAYQGFAKNYQGDKYMICQRDYEKAESYAGEHGYTLIRTGGSVSTTALDLGIALECSSVVFLGLDLSYPDGFVHASNTSRRELTSTEGLRIVTDMNGNQVYTSKSMDMYRKWIEKRLRDEKKNGTTMQFIDATEGGVLIEGMECKSLSNAIDELS